MFRTLPAGTRSIALTLSILLVASTVTAVPGLVLLVQPVAANAPATVAVAQGSNCYEVAPVGDGSQTVEEFYDYRNPETVPSSGTYSSFGTTEYQETSVSSMFIYEGADGTSLVVVHGRTGDGAGGSTITWDISGLPADGDLAVQDDYYLNGTQDDDFNYDDGDSTANINWKYAENRTDGAAFRGLESDDFDTITIDPAYNEEAEAWGEWNRSGSDRYRIDAWRLKEEGGATAADLSLTQRVFIHPGQCVEQTPPEAVINDPGTVTTGEPVTFDASASGDAAGFTWDFDSDGTVDATTTESTATHTYAASGNYTATVTTFDTYGNADTAETEVNVTAPDNSPTALLSVPDSVSVNESVELNASGSTDDGGIGEYRWDFDGDGEIDEITTEATTETTYNTAGNYEVRVTAVDGAGNTDTASAELNVTVPNEPPTASLSVRSSATVSEPITLDASNSTDGDGTIETYEWDFDGDGEIDNITNTPTVEHAYSEVGEYVPTVTVVDDAGSDDTANGTVNVSAAPLSPTIDASATDVAPGETVTFDASRSSPADEITDYAWTFGDGTNATGVTVNHTYDEEGTYEVTLQVTGGDSVTAQTTIEVTVVAEGDGGNGNGDSPGGDEGNNGDNNNGGNNNNAGNSNNGGNNNNGNSGGVGDAPASGGTTGVADNDSPASDPRPAFELSDVDATATEIVAGEEATFSVTVRNTGNASGSKHVTFAVNGTTLANRSVELAPNESASVSFTHQFTTVGDVAIAVGDAAPVDVRVVPAEAKLSVMGVSVNADAVTANERMLINATVRNEGYVEGSMELRLTLFGEVVATETVSVPPGETRTVTFTRRVSAPGTYTASIAGQRVTVDVVADSDAQTSSTGTETTATTTPGFTALAAVLALLVSLAAAVGRRTN